MNLLKSQFFLATIILLLLFTGCLKSNCTDQVKNPELYGIWYYYMIDKDYIYCDSITSRNQQIFYLCEKTIVKRFEVQFANDRFILKALSDTVINPEVDYLIDSDIYDFNKSRFYPVWSYNDNNLEKDWFVDNTTLVICPNNSLCFESDCSVYSWRIEQGKLFIRNDWATWCLIRDDLF